MHRPGGFFLAVAAGTVHSLALKARDVYEDLLVTGTGSRALLQRPITVSGDATIETDMTMANQPTMTVGGHVRVVSGGRVALNGGSIAATGFELGQGGAVEGYGTVDAEFSCLHADAALTADGGTLTVGGAVTLPVTSKSADYTVSASDYFILADASSGDVTISLPKPSMVSGRVYVVKRTDGTINFVYVDDISGGAIDGSDPYILHAQYKFATFISDGSSWWVIASN